MKLPRVAVIGAGIAGLSAAGRLRDNDISTVLFETLRRPGGRVCTQKQHDRQFDHGAQYLTPHSRRSAVLFSKWRKAGWIKPWAALAYDLPERKRLDTSSWHVAVPSQASLADNLAAGLDCRYRATVVGIEGEKGSRYLSTETGESFGPFEIVLCTVPAEAASPLLAPFPELASLASQVQSLPCMATMVMFEDEVMVDFEAAFLSEGPLAWVGRDASKPERPQQECWVLHATEEWSRRHLETPTEQVASLMLSAFAPLCPVELPPISYCRSHRWRHARAEAPLGLPFCFDDLVGIGVAGDWCGAANVDGAYWSGIDLADAVVKSLGARNEGRARKRRASDDP
jgi:hypothetical protein